MHSSSRSARLVRALIAAAVLWIVFAWLSSPAACAALGRSGRLDFVSLAWGAAFGAAAALCLSDRRW